MQTTTTRTLLTAEDAPPFVVERAGGTSPFLLICDHASNRIPPRLGTLGLSSDDLQRHIAWDIGAAGVTLKMSALFDACAILQNYSRLVIDCNRPIGVPTSIPILSEHTAIPGNEQVSADEAGQRANEIFWPYHRRIRTELDTRQAQGRPTILIAMHSFTPVFKGNARGMHVGVLYQRDDRLANRVLDELRRDRDLIVGDNEPYSVSDATDYAIPVYGEQRGLPHVEMEIRQDLIADDAGQTAWALRMADVLRRSAANLV